MGARNTKLSFEAAERIRRDHASGVSIGELTRREAVQRATIQGIIRGELYAPEVPSLLRARVPRWLLEQLRSLAAKDSRPLEAVVSETISRGLGIQ